MFSTIFILLRNYKKSWQRNGLTYRLSSRGRGSETGIEALRRTFLRTLLNPGLRGHSCSAVAHNKWVD